VDELALNFSDSLSLLKIDADHPASSDLLEKYEVKSIPTLILLDENDEYLDRVVGLKSKTDLTLWIEEYLGILF